MTEDDLLCGVLNTLRLFRWRTLHVRPARTLHGFRTPLQGDGIGWPDVLAVRGDRMIAAELKSDHGRLTPEQTAWLDALRDAGAEVHVWRPADYPDRIVGLVR